MIRTAFSEIYLHYKLVTIQKHTQSISQEANCGLVAVATWQESRVQKMRHSWPEAATDVSCISVKSLGQRQGEPILLVISEPIYIISSDTKRGNILRIIRRFGQSKTIYVLFLFLPQTWKKWRSPCLGLVLAFCVLRNWAIHWPGGDIWAGVSHPQLMHNNCKRKPSRIERSQRIGLQQSAASAVLQMLLLPVSRVFCGYTILNNNCNCKVSLTWVHQSIISLATETQIQV